MKYLLAVLLFAGCCITSGKSFAQAQELEQLALDIEKLAQFRQMLKDMEEGFEVLSRGYNAIRDISQGNFNLHKAFLDGLLAISPAVAKYKKIAEIITLQLQLVKEYKAAYSRFKDNKHFNASEISYIAKVYTNLVNESLKNLGTLLDVVTAGKLRMTDDERLTAIDVIYASMQDKLVYLRRFNINTSILSLQKGKEQNDIDVLRRLYDIE